MQHRWASVRTVTALELDAGIFKKDKCRKCGILRLRFKPSSSGRGHNEYRLKQLGLLGPPPRLSGTPPCGPKQKEPCPCGDYAWSIGKRDTHCGNCGAVFPTDSWKKREPNG